MRSARYEILLSDGARAEIHRLHAEQDRGLDALILILLALSKNPTPQSSRPIMEDKAERRLTSGRFEILYRIVNEHRTVEIGVVKVRPL